MKIILLTLLLFSGCKSNLNDENFAKYIENFESIDLPIDINRSNIFSYKRMVFDKSDNRHKRSQYESISSGYHKYITDKETNADYIDYRYLYSLVSNENYYAVVVLEDILEEESDNEIWFTLLTYSSKGILIDKVVIAGYKIDNIEQFVTIDENVNIISKLYEFLPPPDGDYKNMYAKETIYQYEISEKGQIITLSSQIKETKFLETKIGYNELK